MFLNLNYADFTGYSFRPTAVTLVENSGGDIVQLKKMGGWKLSSVAEGELEKRRVHTIEAKNKKDIKLHSMSL
ncbi:hypothetical protein NQ317_014963 [Molorchus minor]|uniref:Uncharacterized protein n=1 Tax=Molorchus minor TaxID=1323400 RepID=A0ABQ9JQ60_9CUCU|nr:hypothetical protein NQ317_014963 [Molorchus minor]